MHRQARISDSNEGADHFTARMNHLMADNRSGSSAIATRFCHSCLAELHRSRSEWTAALFREALAALVDAFPTMALLRTLQDRLRQAGRGQRQSKPDTSRDRYRDLLTAFLEELAENRHQAASHFTQVASRHRSFLTLSTSTAVLEACNAMIQRARDSAPRAARPRVVVCESRPAREGIASARLLSGYGWTVTLITDAAIGHWIENVDAVLLGADWIDRRGFINKTGSLALSKLALLHRKPVYVIGDRLRVRRRAFPITRLPETDAGAILSGPITGVTVKNADFEFIPWKRPHVLVTEAGHLRPIRSGTDLPDQFTIAS